MPIQNSNQVSVDEGMFTFIERRLSGVLMEIDMRTTGRGMFLTFIRSGGLITRTEFYRDSAKTNLAISRDYTRAGPNNLPIQVITTFYEKDGVTIDSTVSGFYERDANDCIIGCSGFFSSDDPVECD